MLRKTIFSASALSLVLVLQSCSDDITKKDISAEVELGSFDLIGSDSGLARANVSGNPACSASSTSLNLLLAKTPNFDDFDDRLDSVDIDDIRYRVTRNNTAMEIAGSMQMTDAETGDLTTVASIEIPANQIVSDWTKFPFTENGEDVIEHFLNKRNDNFTYCAQGAPNSSELDMTLELQLDLTVTVDLF